MQSPRGFPTSLDLSVQNPEIVYLFIGNLTAPMNLSAHPSQSNHWQKQRWTHQPLARRICSSHALVTSSDVQEATSSFLLLVAMPGATSWQGHAFPRRSHQMGADVSSVSFAPRHLRSDVDFAIAITQSNPEA